MIRSGPAQPDLADLSGWGCAGRGGAAVGAATRVHLPRPLSAPCRRRRGRAEAPRRSRARNRPGSARPARADPPRADRDLMSAASRPPPRRLRLPAGGGRRAPCAAAHASIPARRTGLRYFESGPSRTGRRDSGIRAHASRADRRVRARPSHWGVSGTSRARAGGSCRGGRLRIRPDRSARSRACLGKTSGKTRCSLQRAAGSSAASAGR